MYDFFVRQKQRHALYTGQSQTCPLHSLNKDEMRDVDFFFHLKSQTRKIKEQNPFIGTHQPFPQILLLHLHI